MYLFIQSKGLGQYYDIRKKLGDSNRPASVISEDFSYLDEPEFIRAYGTPTGPLWQMRFYLEGVHCSACVWVVEKLTDAEAGVDQVRLDLGNRVATVTSGAGQFAKVARELAQLGYRPHPVRDGEEEGLLKQENRKLLARIAVAGTCAGNIMLLAVSLYAGLGGHMARIFEIVSAAMFLPVLFYSSTPLFRSAWNSLWQRSISIDVPVVLGILLGTATSYFNLFSGGKNLYFDSLSTLIFLLLASRYLLRRAQQSSMSQTQLLRFITPSSARKIGESGPRPVRVESLRPGDRIQVRAGETIPCDGTIVRGTALIDQSLLTGEPRPERFKTGDKVYSGTVDESGVLEIEIQHLGYQSRLGQILRSAESSLAQKARILGFSDRIARKFTVGLIILVVAIFFLRLHTGWDAALNQALAVSLVACPCAFALAAPLAMSMTIGRLARAGILVKGSESLEKLATADSVFVDKTGTLTEGHLRIVEWQAASADVERAVLAIESLSNHPVAHALVRYLSSRAQEARRADQAPLTPSHVSEFEEILGRGVRGRFDGKLYEIRRRSQSSEIEILQDGKPVAMARTGDKLRDDSLSAVQELRSLGLEVHILSGDASESVAEVAALLKIPDGNALGGVSPEDKSKILHAHPRAMMVGDGANDAAALAASYVGVAVHNGAEISLRTSDIYACNPGIHSAVQLVTAGRETLKVIRRGFAISLIYNIVAAIGAILGWINPLFAAVLMPISAFTLFISSIAGTPKLREIAKFPRETQTVC